MGKRKDNLPTKAKIADYWKDKKFPNGDLIIDDWYEPSCWSCGFYHQNHQEGELIEQGKFNNLWNHPIYGLERCHIIPKALGGSDEVDNLFLMCKYCHKSSPDTTNPDYFFEWVMKRSLEDTIKESPQWKAFEQLLEQGYTYDKLNLFLEKLRTGAIELDLEINTHGFEFSDSTLKYSYIDAFNKYIKSEATICE